MRIALTAPMYGRHDTVRRCLELNRAVGIDEFVYCYHTDDDRKFCIENDVDCIKVNQNNISYKAQCALWYARRVFDLCDAVIMMGSDDYLDQAAYDLIVEKLVDHDYISFRDIIFESGGHEYLWKGYAKGNPRHGEPAGAGKVIRRDLLNRIEWNVWSDYNIGRTDYVAHRMLITECTSSYTISCATDNVRLVDVKDRHSTTPLSRFKPTDLQRLT